MENRLKKLFVILELNLIFIFVNIIIFDYYLSSYKNVNISFIFNFLVILVFLNWLLIKKNFDPFNTIVWVFFYLFFLIAPFIQTINGVYPNTFPLKSNLVYKTNILVAMFIIFYLFIYSVIQYFLKRKNDKKTIDINESTYNIISQKTFYIIAILCVGVFLLFFKYVANLIIYRIPLYELENVRLLILHKCLFVIPLFLLVYTILERKRFNKKYYFIVLVGAFFLTFWFINPFTDKRNAIGTSFIALAMVFLRKYIKTNTAFLIFLLSIMIVLFPLSGIFTHSKEGIEYYTEQENYKYEFNLEKEFSSLNYDAWANFMATVEYTDKNGITYGRQLLGAISFYVPRALWTTKPLSTGEYIAYYLKSNYRMWFKNLSNPFPSEAYINFGVFGIFIFALLLALWGNWINQLVLRGGYSWFVGVYLSVYTLFILRGDLMNGIAYTTGAFIAIYILPLTINRLVGGKKGIKISM